jgi:hypothetical protein
LSFFWAKANANVHNATTEKTAGFIDVVPL